MLPFSSYSTSDFEEGIMNKTSCFVAVTVVLGIITAGVAFSQEKDLPIYLTDRGTGVPSSMFATFIETGRLITYLYYEFYLDNTVTQLRYGVQ